MVCSPPAYRVTFFDQDGSAIRIETVTADSADDAIDLVGQSLHPYPIDIHEANVSSCDFRLGPHR